MDFKDWSADDDLLPADPLDERPFVGWKFYKGVFWMAVAELLLILAGIGCFYGGAYLARRFMP